MTSCRAALWLGVDAVAHLYAISAKYLIGYGSTLESFLFASSSFICQVQKSSLYICSIILNVLGLKKAQKKCFAIKTSILTYFGLFHVVFVLAWERKTNPPAFFTWNRYHNFKWISYWTVPNGKKGIILSTSVEESVTVWVDHSDELWFQVLSQGIPLLQLLDFTAEFQQMCC